MSVFLAASSPALLTKAFVISFAAAGGIFVFLGLLLEKIAEWKSDKHIVKPCKHLSEWGWYILMLGIVLEIGVAVWSAIDAWETRQMAIENNPLNQPVSSIAALARFKVKGADFPTNAPAVGDGIASLLLCDEYIEMSKYESLVADDFTPVGNNGDTREYWIKFHPFIISEAGRLGFPSQLKVGDVTNGVRFLTICTRLIPTNSEIVEGFSEVTINNTKMAFRILPQTNTLIPRFGKPFGFILVATNCALECVTQKLAK